MLLARTPVALPARQIGARYVGPIRFSRGSKRCTVSRYAGNNPDGGDKIEELKKAATDAAAAAVSDLGAAAKETYLALAKESSSQLDSVVNKLSESVAGVKTEATTNAKSASAAFDNLVATMIQNTQNIKGSFANKSPEIGAKIDGAVATFAATANELRQKVAAKKLTWGEAFDKLQAAIVATGIEVRGLVTEVAASGAGISPQELAAQIPSTIKQAVPAPTPAPASSSPTSSPEGIGAVIANTFQLIISLGSLYYLDKGIKTLFTQYAIKFPSALAGMFGVFAVLCLVGDSAANKILGYYNPGLNWIARWLPLFYVPALVTLPLALQGIPGADLLRIVGILSVGMVATLMFTAQITVFIREAVKTPVKEIAKAKPSPPFETSHYASWGAIGAFSMAATLLAKDSLGAQMALPFGLAATIGGYLIGCLVPKDLHGVLHPVLVTAVVANAGAALHGAIMGWSYTKAQQVYLAKGAGPMGAGDVLMSLLGIVIISFGFRVYTQRDTMKRHFPEIFGATVLSAIFSLFSTAFAAKAVGLSSALARALVPRSVTVALALPIAQGLEAPLAITAAAVLLQGILGANFGPNLMTKFGVKDTIARGLAAAGTAGGLGTASLTSKEPEALPFCALSYALVGIFSTVIMSVPAVRDVVIAIVG